jgi:hypothetical protein
MIGHEHPAMHCYLEPLGPIRQPVGICCKVGVTRKNGLPVVAALDNMDRISSRTESGPSWHGSVFLTQEEPSSRVLLLHAMSICRTHRQEIAAAICRFTLSLYSDPKTTASAIQGFIWHLPDERLRLVPTSAIEKPALVFF